MKISIITPTFNSGKTIRRNIESVVGQTYKNYEHIIIDNDSREDTVALARGVYEQAGQADKVRIYSERDRGISDGFNKGISAASGDIISILNSDDSFFDNTVLQTVVAAFQTSDKLLVHGNINFIDPVYGSNIRKPLPSGPVGITFNHQTMFVKRKIYSEAGLYDINFKYSMDYEFYCRLKLRYGDTGNISTYLAQPLVTMNAFGASWKNEINSIEEIKKALILHGLWDMKGRMFYSGRIVRTKLKHYFTKVGMNKLVELWRKHKWAD